MTAKVIVVAGKGGIGKTTITALLVKSLAAKFNGRIMLVDGDPDACLNLAMGIPDPPATIAQVKDQIAFTAGDVRQSGVSTVEYMTRKLRQAGIVQTHQIQANSPIMFDFMGMGVNSGENGCYCAINAALGSAFAQMQSNYDLIIIDSPAGTEHLSRQRIKNADVFCVVESDNPTAKAIAGRIERKARDSGMEVGHWLRINNFHRSSVTNYTVTPATDERRTWVHFPYDTRLAEGALAYQLSGLSPALGASYQLGNLVYNLLEKQGKHDQNGA